jgi:hypothetical protein
MVIVFPAHVADTPEGKPLAPLTPSFAIPVAPVVVCVISVKAVLIHKVGVEEAAPTVLSAVTVMVPVALTAPQPPVNKMLYGNAPATLGVPLMVIVFPAHVAEVPAGKPLAPSTPSLAMPVAPVVVCVMSVKAVLIHKVGVEEATLAVLSAVTVMVPVALTVPHPPVNKIL